jgi:cytochrome c-type biogenesis protein CcmH
MTLWLIFSCVMAGVLALLLIPLLRRPTAAAARIDYDIVVYRDQLAEVERDVERDLLNRDQADAARNEILRRMLAAEDAELAAVNGRPGGERGLRRTAALVILVGIPLGSFALYGLLGSPGLPGQPYTSRQADPSFQVEQLAERLAAELRAKPDADRFATLGETYFTLRRYGDAIAAFQQALELGAADPQMLATLGEAITLANGGEVGEEARHAFSQALSLDGRDPRARFYLGLAKAQAGKFREAVAIWRDLQKDSASDAPWLGMLNEHIASYAKQGGFDPATVAATPPVPEEGQTVEEAGPGGGGAAAILSQSPEEREKTIKSMVDGLAARLEQNPDDLEGWLRLVRSYRTLNDLGRARQAAERAVKLKPRAVEPRLMLGEIQLASAKGDRLPADFIDTMRAVLDLDPNNDEAMYYVGAAEAQDGHADRARKIWSRLLDILPQDSPHRQQLLKQIADLPKG